MLFNGWKEDIFMFKLDCMVLENGQVLAYQMKLEDGIPMKYAKTIDPKKINDIYLNQQSVKKEITKFTAKQLLKERK